MPIEIRELVIRARIEPRAQPDGSSRRAGERSRPTPERAPSAEDVLRVMRDKQER